jgi:hypothetical protein
MPPRKSAGAGAGPLQPAPLCAALPAAAPRSRNKKAPPPGEPPQPPGDTALGGLLASEGCSRKKASAAKATAAERDAEGVVALASRVFAGGDAIGVPSHREGGIPGAALTSGEDRLLQQPLHATVAGDIADDDEVDVEGDADEADGDADEADGDPDDVDDAKSLDDIDDVDEAAEEDEANSEDGDGSDAGENSEDGEEEEDDDDEAGAGPGDGDGDENTLDIGNGTTIIDTAFDGGDAEGATAVDEEAGYIGVPSGKRDTKMNAAMLQARLVSKCRAMLGLRKKPRKQKALDDRIVMLDLETDYLPDDR